MCGIVVTTERGIIMFCPKCKREYAAGANSCPYCGEIFFNEQTQQETQSADDAHKEKEVKVNAGIYKLICVAMGFCLVAGSVVWATLMLRDRMDSPVRSSSSAVPQEQSENEKQSAVTTAPKATTTVTTTTVNPYEQAVSPKFEDDYGTMYAIADSLVMRIGPGYDYLKLETDSIPSGTAFSVLAEQEDAKSGETWCYTAFGDDSGWICKSFLSEKNPTVAVVLPDEIYDEIDISTVEVIRSGGLKLYSGPDDTYDVLAEIPEGTEITKCGYNYFSVKWIYVCYEDQYGWVMSYDGDWFNPSIE